MPILVGTVPLAPLQQASSNPEFFGATAPPSHHAGMFNLSLFYHNQNV